MIELTPEMVRAFSDADFSGCGNADWEDSHVRVGLAAVLAIVERDRSDAPGLTRGANAARRIADRYGEKGRNRERPDWQIWTAMSAGARAVAVRLAELADAEEAPVVHQLVAGDEHVHCCGRALADLPDGARTTLNPHGVTCRREVAGG